MKTPNLIVFVEGTSYDSAVHERVGGQCVVVLLLGGGEGNSVKG